MDTKCFTAWPLCAHATDFRTVKVQGTVQLFFDKGLLTFRRNKKEIWFNTPSNKTRMLVVPFNEDPLYLATSYLQSDEGIDSLKMLENLVEG